MKLYEKLGGIIEAIKNCEESNNQEWIQKHGETLRQLIEELPHGSGIDGNTIIDTNRCRRDLIIINSSYHCMNDCGMYDGWIDFEVWIRPSFSGIDLDVKGRFSDRHCKYSATKEYLLDVFAGALDEDVDQ